MVSTRTYIVLQTVPRGCFTYVNTLDFIYQTLFIRRKNIDHTDIQLEILTEQR